MRNKTIARGFSRAVTTLAAAALAAGVIILAPASTQAGPISHTTQTATLNPSVLAPAAHAAQHALNDTHEKMISPDDGAWQARHNLNAAQYQTEYDSLSRQGYRLVQVSGYSVNNDTRFAAIWDKSNGPPQQARHNLNAAQYQTEFDSLGADGYRLVQVSGYSVNNDARFAAIWNKVPGPRKRPLAVVLCKFTDQQAEPHNVAYYQDMFSETGAGRHGVFDFWKNVSYGNLDLAGTVVKGWYTADKTAAEFNVLGRPAQINVCASKATKDIDFNKFAGVVVLTNHTKFNGPLFGGKGPTVIAGTTYAKLGDMAAEEDQVLSAIMHESGHAFGLDHSRRVTQLPGQDDYGDTYDIMSCLGCSMTPSYEGAAVYQATGGPGLNVVQLDSAGWMPADRVLTFDNNSCMQRSLPMAAVNHPEAPGSLEVRIPAAVPITKIGSSTTSDYYTVELRSKSGWDAGIPTDAFILHLRGKDNFSYWVDKAGGLTTGAQYVDAPQRTSITVTSIDPKAHTGVITVGC
jgi:hypothetical protein